MVQISVLMSVYNENENELRKSIESILKQTYTNFEFIIVIDNPGNVNISEIISAYANRDNRIKIIRNEINLGLASSLNRAASIAIGNYFLRMDADDISDLKRFELQYKIISDSVYDVVCSDYYFIDESGNLLNKPTAWYDSYSINKLMPLRNVVHHPTIIMRAESLRKIGGYRDFPCAQDYDLWLRMIGAGCKFFMMREKLLYYRIRTESTTKKNRHKQQCTLNYIRNMHQQKQMNGEDIYSYDAYIKYLVQKGVGNETVEQDFLDNYNKYMSAITEIRKGKLLSGVNKAVQVIFCSKNYRPVPINSIRFALLSKLLKMQYKILIRKGK